MRYKGASVWVSSSHSRFIQKHFPVNVCPTEQCLPSALGCRGNLERVDLVQTSERQVLGCWCWAPTRLPDNGSDVAGPSFSLGLRI